MLKTQGPVWTAHHLGLPGSSTPDWPLVTSLAGVTSAQDGREGTVQSPLNTRTRSWWGSRCQRCRQVGGVLDMGILQGSHYLISLLLKVVVVVIICGFNFVQCFGILCQRAATDPHPILLSPQ